jgi:predicted glycogen debranching enzyme
MPHPVTREWLETDGMGGFASGTVSGRRTRRYHALLLVTTHTAGRFVLINGFDACVETPAGRFAISSQHYEPDVISPDGERRIVEFTPEPCPRWVFRLDDGTRVKQECFVPHGRQAAVLRWRLVEPKSGVALHVRPFFSGRDYHSLHHENPAFRFDPQAEGRTLVWRPYPGVPGTVISANGSYSHAPVWYRNFLYVEEQARGLDCTEDLAAPGVFHWDLSAGEAVILLTAEGPQSLALGNAVPEQLASELWTAEAKRRAAFPGRLHRAADAYIVARGVGKTIIAGYPWFTDWGRDTFIALRGLCLTTGRLDDTSAILRAWADTVSEGMLPNRFPDRGGTPEYNSVDASLWYVIAVHDFMESMRAAGGALAADVTEPLRHAVDTILAGYAHGTRYGIRLDGDGLIAAGEPGVQLTWMDAKVGAWVVTPRIGKPVEIQALWLNALHIAGSWTDRWQASLQQGLKTFRSRFWNESAGYLYDVIDVDHRPGTTDPTFRPNQILAVGGLPVPLLEGAQARRVVDAVEAQLWTPLGLRSLAATMPGYRPHYEGGVRARDGAYHQGTVWSWLIGPFVEAWLRVRENTPAARREAQSRFIAPLLAHLDEAGLGHVSEIADGEPPHTPRGCPFQAWSVGELLRLQYGLLAEGDRPHASSLGPAQGPSSHQ